MAGTIDRTLNAGLDLSPRLGLPVRAPNDLNIERHFSGGQPRPGIKELDLKEAGPVGLF
jgi:hypothetical protein